jgi:hypothetical protein
MIKSFVKTGLYAIMASALIASSVVPTYAAPAAKPLNAGKNGIKSNAGAGDGVEQGALLTTAPTTTTTYSDPYTVYGPTSTEYLPLPPTTTTVTKVATGTPYSAGGNGNSALKQNYLVTTTTTTWNGEKYVETTQTEIWQEKVTSTVITSTYAEIDPGQSGAHNQSPEGSTVVESSAPVIETVDEFVSVGAPEVNTVDTSVSTDVDVTKTVTENYSPNSQGGSTP